MLKKYDISETDKQRGLALQKTDKTKESAISAALESVQTTDEARRILRECYP